MAENKAAVVTRIPESMHRYLKPLAYYKYKTMNDMFQTALIHFLYEKPWEKGMKFRKSKSTGEGFEQINIRVSPDIKQIIDAEAKDQNQSVATFVYTALFWWSWYIWPPKTKLSKEWQDFFIQYPEKFEAELKESFFGAKEVEG